MCTLEKVACRDHLSLCFSITHLHAKEKLSFQVKLLFYVFLANIGHKSLIFFINYNVWKLIFLSFKSIIFFLLFFLRFSSKHYSRFIILRLTFSQANIVSSLLYFFTSFFRANIVSILLYFFLLFLNEHIREASCVSSIVVRACCSVSRSFRHTD